MIIWALVIPPLVLAHVIGAILIAYSLSKITGGKVSIRRLGRGKHRGVTEQELHKLPSSRGTAPSTNGPVQDGSVCPAPVLTWTSKDGDSTDEAAPDAANSAAWIRGCQCKACSCPQRWIPANMHATAGDLIPAVQTTDLASSSNSSTYPPLSPTTPSKPDSLTARCPSDLTWSNLGCRIRLKRGHAEKTLLEGCSGAVCPGELCAIVGPSGAGKSTLLDMLSMRKTTGILTGEVRVNGSPTGVLFRRVSAYVAQEEAFEPTYTALETLTFHAALTVPSSVSEQEQLDKIDEVLMRMGLWSARHTPAGGVLAGGLFVRGLSGGERKRLNVACALVASPSILFLDEPTTGLDAAAALQVMTHMRQLANQGHIVLASIHQPRVAIWNLLDQVAVLSEGRSLYFGPTSDVVPWFRDELGYPYDVQTHGTPSDWVMDLVSVSFHLDKAHETRTMMSVAEVTSAAQRYHDSIAVTPVGLAGSQQPTSSDLPASTIPPSPATPPTNAALQCPTKGTLWGCCAPGTAVGQYPVSWGTQFCTLAARQFVAQLRNPTDAAGKLMAASWLALLIGVTYINMAEPSDTILRRLSMLFFFCLTMTLMPFQNMSSYTSARKFYATDRAANLYPASAYAVASLVAHTPLPVVYALTGVFISYGLAGLRDTAYAIIVTGVVLSLLLITTSQCLVMCIALTPNQDLAFMLGTAYMAICILLGGFNIRVDTLKWAVLRWLSYLTFMRYPFGAVAHLQFDGVTWTDNCSRDLWSALAEAFNPVARKPPCGMTGDEVLAGAGYDMGVGESIGIMLAFFAVFSFANYLAMSRLYVQKR